MIKNKKYIFIIACVYMIIVTLSALINLNNSVSYVYLKDSKENKASLEKLKNQTKKVNNEKCRNAINQLINKYEDTSYNDKVNLKELYNENPTYLLLYMTIKKDCKITKKEEKDYNLPSLLLNAQIDDEKLFQNYMFQYELNFKDTYSREMLEIDLIQIQYKLQRETLLHSISHLLEIEKNRGEYNEK